jgi:hypothetical protein
VFVEQEEESTFKTVVVGATVTTRHTPTQRSTLKLKGVVTPSSGHSRNDTGPRCVIGCGRRSLNCGPIWEKCE